MARRGIVVVFTLLGIAFFISVAGFALLYLALGREPAVPSNATLVLRVGGELPEISSSDIVGYLRGVRTPTVRSIVDNLRKAKVDSRIGAVLLKPTGFDIAVLGKGAGDPRRDRSTSSKSGKPVYAYLEYGGDREYYLATAADKVFLLPSSPLDLERHRHLPGVPARDARQDWRVSRPASHRRLQDRGQHLHREGLHAGAQGNGRVAQSRSLRSARSRNRRRAQEERGGSPRVCSTRGRSCPRRLCAPGLVDDVAYEDQVDDKLTAPRRRRGSFEGDDYARISLSSVGLNRGPRIGVIYAAGTINSGKSGFDPVNGAVVGSDTLIEYIRQARRDSSLRAHRPAHRQPGRIGDRVRRHLAGVDDRQQRARRPSAGRLDVRSRGVRRLLHRHAGAGDRRPAVDVDGIDRHLRRKVRDRRRLRKARRAHRVHQYRQARRDRIRRPARTTPTK